MFSFCTLGANSNCFQVAHEMDMICHVEKTASMFEDSWKTYAQIILRYSKSIPFQTKELKKILKSIDTDDDDEDDDSDGNKFQCQ